MTPGAGVGIGVAIAATLAAVGYAFYSSSSTNSSGSQSPLTIVKGQRYRATLTYAPPLSASTAASINVTTVQNELDAAMPGLVRVNTTSVIAPAFSTMTMDFDCLLTPPPNTPTTALFGGSGASAVIIQPLGATPGGGGGLGTWTPATMITAGQRVRIAVLASDFAPLAAALTPALPNSLLGFSEFLKSPAIAAFLQPVSNQMTFYKPGDPPPAGGWTSDDTNAAAEYHVEFTYGGSLPFSVAQLIVPAKIWTQPTASSSVHSGLII